MGTLVDNGGVNATYTGAIAETIILPWTATTGERNRIETYLAIKYGLTLSGSDYVASDGLTTVWNSSANSDYHNNVTII